MNSRLYKNIYFFSHLLNTVSSIQNKNIKREYSLINFHVKLCSKLFMNYFIKSHISPDEVYVIFTISR